MDSYITYLQSLRPDQLKQIRAAWRVGARRIEEAHPAIAGWTRHRPLPHLIAAGVFSSHPRIGMTPLVVAVRDRVREKALHHALEGSLAHLEDVLREWVRFVPDQTALDCDRLFRDLCGWDHPKRPVQDRWRREFYGRTHEN